MFDQKRLLLIHCPARLFDPSASRHLQHLLQLVPGGRMDSLRDGVRHRRCMPARDAAVLPKPQDQCALLAFAAESVRSLAAVQPDDVGWLCEVSG